MNNSLPQLWKSILEGDSRSWEKLVRRYNPLIIAVARSHGLAVADLEDCAQQTWLALYKGRDKIENSHSIPAWLVRVAKRKAQRIQLSGKTRLSAEEQFDPVTQIPSPEELYIEALEAAKIHTALEMLDPRCKILLGKLYFANEEWSYKEIAIGLGLAPNSLGSIRSRCLEKLRVILEKLDNEMN